MSSEVCIVRTGVANTASVIAAFERLGAVSKISDDAEEVLAAPAAVVPGVGTFGAAMEALRANDMVEVIRERIERDQPTLAICAGYQVLFAASEESSEVSGLKILSDSVRRFRGDVRIPQFGWNMVTASPGSRIVQTGFAYFANSYAVAVDEMREEELSSMGWSISVSVHGVPFIAAVERGNLLGCQFHPELSGPWGQQLIGRWLERVNMHVPKLSAELSGGDETREAGGGSTEVAGC